MRRKVLIGIAVIILAFILIGLYNGLEVTTYTIRSAKVKKPFRLVLVSDMHSCNYGENAQALIKAVENQHPDLVLLGGDIFDDILPDDNASALLKGISGHFPCFYVTGNHECWGTDERFAQQMHILEENHITRLDDACVTLEDIGINLCGVNDPYAYKTDSHAELQIALENTAQVSANGYFTILLSHRPELFEDYCRYPFDLVLTGHAHGGQWRLPFLLSGIYAPHQGVFPRYTYGIHQQGNTQMIISRGLAKESTHVPRFYNRPELVVVDVVPE